MTRKIYCFFTLLCLYATCVAKDFQACVDEFCNRSAYKSANISILFRDLDSDSVIASFRPNSSVPTASTLKVITTATALETLGADFRFPTYLETDGEITNGILNGNIYIRGTGDPTLGSRYLGDADFMPKWVKAIREAGITQINGSIIADVSAYDPAEAIPYGWTREDIGNYYAAGVFPLCYNDNITTLFINSGSIGSKAEILSTDPFMPNVEFENYLTCGTGRDWLASCMPYSNLCTLSGNIVPNKGRWSIKIAMPNPPLLLAQNFAGALNSNNIRVENAAKYSKQNDSLTNRKIIYTHYSVPLRDIIAETNQQSNNMYAEQIFRLLGSEFVNKITSKPILIADCIEYEKLFWRNIAIDLNSSFIYDGSGLSPQDAVSASTLVSILTYMGKYSRFKNEWTASLPISGKSGTLRGFLTETKLENKVIAKSGTTSRVKAYAGYINADDGHTYVFAVMVNNANIKSKVVQHNIANLLLNMF